jgi:hypothetical protein
VSPSRNVVYLGMEVHAYNPISWEAEEVGSQVPVQPGLLTKTLSPKTNKNKYCLVAKKYRKRKSFLSKDIKGFRYILLAPFNKAL